MSTKKDKDTSTEMKSLVDPSIFATREKSPEIKPSETERIHVSVRSGFFHAAITALFVGLREYATLFLTRMKETKEVIEVDLQSIRIYWGKEAGSCNKEGIAVGDAVTGTTAVPPGQNVYVRRADGTEVPYNPKDAGFNLTKEVRPILLTEHFAEFREDLAKFGVNMEKFRDQLLKEREDAIDSRKRRQTRRASTAARQQQRAPQGRRPDIQYEDEGASGSFDDNITKDV